MATTVTLKASGTPTILFATQDMASIVGSGPVLADGSDATYVQVQSTNDRRGVAESLMEQLDPTIDPTTVTSIVVRIRASANYATPFDLRFYAGEGQSGGYRLFVGAETSAAADGSIGDYSKVNPWFGTDPSFAIAMLQSGTCYADLMAQGPATTLRYYEVSVDVTYESAEPVGVPQPYRARQRLYPTAPARRWPREAWQGSSSRRVGGYR